MMGPLIRRSLASTALPAYGLVIAAHLVLRPTRWRSEWMWTFDAYNFVVMLLAPVLAGVACWDGARWSASRPQIESSGRTAAAFARLWAAHAVVALGAFAAGLTVAVVRTITGTAPGLPGWRPIVSVLPALALLGAAIALGLGVGWRTRRALLAPLVAMAAFGLMIVGYTAAPGLFVHVGGATGSLLGLQPRLEVMAAQVAFYASVIAAVVAVVAAQVSHAPRARVASGATLACCVGAAAVMVSLGGRAFDNTPVPVRCDHQRVNICLAPGYTHQRKAFHTALDPVVTTLQDAGLVHRVRLTQDLHDHGDDVALLPTTVARDASTITSIVYQLLVPRTCETAPDASNQEAFFGVTDWLFELAGEPTYDPTQPLPPWAGDDPETRAWVRAAVAQLRAQCDN